MKMRIFGIVAVNFAKERAQKEQLMYIAELKPLNKHNGIMEAV